MQHNYRNLLVLCLFALSGPVFAQTPLAEGHSKFLGNVHSPSQLNGFLSYWNQVTPENAGKWGSVESTRDNMNWTALDAAYNFAKDNGLPYKHHVLIWGNQQPSWIESLPATEQLAEIEEWFSEVAARYPDIDYIEVVNEPLHDPPSGAGNGNYMNALGGSGTTGWDWIIKSFELARIYFPNTELMINDYAIVGSASNTAEYKVIIDLLNDRGLIDQIGVQCHAFTVNDLPAATITTNLNTLASTGLPIYVTELDIDGSDDATQLERYKRVFPALWEHDAVQGVTLWGWRNGMWRSAQGAYLIATDGVTERPALKWLRTYLNDLISPVTSVPQKIEAGNYDLWPNPTENGTFTIRGIDKSSRVRILDRNGRLMKEHVFSGSSSNEVGFENLNPGMYAVQIIEGENVTTKKIVVK